MGGEFVYEVPVYLSVADAAMDGQETTSAIAEHMTELSMAQVKERMRKKLCGIVGT